MNAMATPSWLRGKALPGVLLALFAVVVWGATFTLSKQILLSVPPLLLLLARFVVGYLALWAIHPHPLPWQGWRTEGRFALMGLLGVTLYFCGENLALVHGSAGMVSVVVCISPVLTALLPRLYGRGTPLGRTYWAGFLLAMLGVTLTVSGGNLATLRGAWLGALLAAGGALAWAGYTLVSQSLPAKLGRLAITRRTFFWGLLTMLPLCLSEPAPWSWSALTAWPTLWRILTLGLVAGATCYAAWGYAISRLGPIRTSLLLYLIPLIGVLTAALFLGEPLCATILLGVTLTLLGVALCAHRQHA